MVTDLHLGVLAELVPVAELRKVGGDGPPPGSSDGVVIGRSVKSPSPLGIHQKDLKKGGERNLPSLVVRRIWKRLN